MRVPVAAIDCGTNTIKLLVTDGATEHVRTARMVRLGQGVDRTGRLDEAALARAVEAVEEYAGLIRDHGVERVRFCATSATRDASNGADFTDAVLALLGVAPEVLSGAEEAALSFDGALRHLAVAPEGEVVVLDIGGGSTELVRGRCGEQPVGHSMDIGSVRLHERHLASDPPDAAEVDRVVADVDRALDACPIDLSSVTTVIGVAGTVTTVAAGVLQLAAYDRSVIDQQVLPVEQVQRHVAELVRLSVAERRELPWMHPGRADVIGAGALILSRVLARSEADDLVVSEHDILDGIAASLLDRG